MGFGLKQSGLVLRAETFLGNPFCSMPDLLHSRENEAPVYVTKASRLRSNRGDRDAVCS
jgi:hypothetical protein